MLVFMLARREHGVAQGALVAKAAFLIAADTPRVVGVDAQKDPVQVQLIEGVTQQSRDGIGAVSLTPVILFADDDTQLGLVIDAGL